MKNKKCKCEHNIFYYMNTEQKHTNICITKRGDSLFYKTILIVKYLGSVLWDVWKYVTWKTGRPTHHRICQVLESRFWRNVCSWWTKISFLKSTRIHAFFAFQNQLELTSLLIKLQNISKNTLGTWLIHKMFQL